MIDISFIVPVYKVEEDYLRMCIESILKIKYKKMELILIDDGSPDKCGEICDEYMEKDSRVVSVHKLNEGVSEARNYGIKLSKGKFITFVDADDWIDSSVMDEIIEKAVTLESDIIIYGQYIEYKGKKREEIRAFSTDKTFRNKNDLNAIQRMVFVREFNSMKTFYGSAVICNAVDKFINRDFLMNTDIYFDKNIKIGEDSYFYLQLFNECKMVSYIDKCAYHYRMRKNSACHSPILTGYKDIYIFSDKVLGFLNDNNKEKDYYWAFYCRIYDLIFELLNKTYLDVDMPLMNKLYRFQHELNMHPFDEAIRVSEVKNQTTKGKIVLIIFKLKIGWLYLLFKEIKNKVIKSKNRDAYY